jgi:putative flippase GtrA
MGGLDFVITRVFITMIPFFAVHWSGAKFLSSLIGFIGNFILRKILVFPEKKRKSHA